MGWTNGPDGLLTFHVVSGMYDVTIVDWSNHYVLYTINQDFTDPTGAVNFDMSVQPSSELIVNHPYDSLSDVYIHPVQGNLASFGWSDLPGGTHFILSSDLDYGVNQETYRPGLNGVNWSYTFAPNNYIINLGPDVVYDFKVGGTLSVSGRTEQATAGERITLTDSTKDNFGNMLTYIYTYTEEYGNWWNVYPKIELTDPNGGITNFEYHGWYNLRFHLRWVYTRCISNGIPAHIREH